MIFDRWEGQSRGDGLEHEVQNEGDVFGTSPCLYEGLTVRGIEWKERYEGSHTLTVDRVPR